MTTDQPTILRAIEWLLALDKIRLGHDAPLSLQWNSPFPGWLVLGASAGILLVVVLVYWKERGAVRRRLMLGATRTALLGLVVAMLCQPALILQRNLVSPSHIALLIDTSSSMSRGDPVAGSTTERRLELVRQALLADERAALRGLLARNQLRTYQFSDSVQPLGQTATAEELDQLAGQLAKLRAEGQSTDLAHSLEEVMIAANGGRLAAVVLASDGQSTAATPLAGVIAVAKAQQIPVYPLLVGSPIPPRDVGIAGVEWDARVFAEDILAVRVRLEASGWNTPTPVAVRLVDQQSGDVVANQTVNIGGANNTTLIELRAKPTQPGARRYRIELIAQQADADAENNADVIDVWVHDEPIRVLYVEQMPRYEYRYLKNALIREDTVRAGALLLDADAEFAQEGTLPVRRFPETPEELDGYDVVLFGDVDPTAGWLTNAQAEMLVEFVGKGGGGFGLIAGERNAPHRFRGTPLEKLIPVRIDPDFLGGYTRTLSVSFVPRLTPAGRRSRLFRFDLEGDREADAVVDTLPGWYWFARTLGPRPGAEVLLEHPVIDGADGPMPLVVAGRYGAGKILFHGSDDSWRWRRGTGELIFDAYWIQIIRALSPSPPQAGARRIDIRPAKRRYAPGERVEVGVRIADAELLPSLGDQIELTVRDTDGNVVAKASAKRLSPTSARFEGSFIPPEPGTFSMSADATTPNEQAAVIRVDRATLESRHLEANHAILNELATQTGGKTVALDRLTEVFSELRDRSIRIPDDVRESLWDSRLAFILFALLLTCEWILRKVYGMI